VLSVLRDLDHRSSRTSSLTTPYLNQKIIIVRSLGLKNGPSVENNVGTG
jgi:hypothetical protein